MSMLRVGIIGSGVGLRTLVPGFRRTGRAEVTAMAGSSDSRAAELGSSAGIPFTTGDFRAVCDSPNVDLICVASPTGMHLEHALYALSTGKPVYLEKPIGVTASDGAEIASAQMADQMVVVGHQLRFNPYLRALRDLISDGALGRVYDLAIDQVAPGFSNAQRPWTWEFEAPGGGVRLAMGSHQIDLAAFLLGGKVGSIVAVADPVHRVRHPEGGAERVCSVSNFFGATFTIGSSVARISTSAAGHQAFNFKVTVRGEAADATYGPADRLLVHRGAGDSTLVCSAAVDEEYERRKASSIFSTSFTYFADEIVDAIAAGSAAVDGSAGLEDAVENLRVLDAALESQRIGQVKTVNGGWQELESS